jgi:hypothetical protein
VDLPGTARAVALRGSHLFVAADQAGMLVVDVADPDHPVQVHAVAATAGAQDLVLDGDFAFVAAGTRGFLVVDITSPLTATVDATVPTAGAAQGLFRQGNLLLVAVAGAGLQIFDVSDPTSPQLIRQVIMPGTAYDVAAAGYYAYVAAGAGGIQVVDLSNPPTARVVTAVHTPGNAKGVACREGMVYVADGDHGVGAASLTPIYFPEAYWLFDNDGRDQTGQHPVTLAGDAIYQAAMIDSTQAWGLFTADVSSFASCIPPLATIHTGRLTCVFSLTDAWAADAGFTGSIELVASVSPDSSRGDFRLGLDPADGTLRFSLVDTASGSGLDLRSGVDAWADSVWYEVVVNWDGFGRSMQVSWSDSLGDHVDLVSDDLVAPCFADYASTTRLGGRHVDSPPTGLTINSLRIEESSPVLVPISNLALAGYAQDLACHDKYVLVACERGDLQVIDFSTPGQPRLAGTVDTPNRGQGVCAAADAAYVADGDRGVQVIACPSFESPPQLGNWETPGSPFGLVVAGEVALIADGQEGLQVIDVAMPTSPRLMSQFVTQGDAVDVAVSGTRAIVAEVVFAKSLEAAAGRLGVPVGIDRLADSGAMLTALFPKAAGVSKAGLEVPYSGLQILDLSNPSLPVLLGTIETPGYALDVELSGQTAYVADFSGFRIIDISRPNAPEIVGSLTALGLPRDLAVVGNLVYVADLDGLKIIDVSLPTAPQVLGAVATPGPAYGVAADGTLAYVADVEAGLHVVDVANPAAPVVVGTVAMPGGAYDVEVIGNFAYVADGFDTEHSCLQVVDVSVPTAPRLAGQWDASGSVYAVALEGGRVFVTDGAGGMQVRDGQCDPGFRAAADLAVVAGGIRFSAPAGPAEVAVGMDLAIRVVVANHGGRSATGRLVCEYEAEDGTRLPVGEALVSLNRQGNSAAAMLVEFPWRVQRANTVIHVTLTDVQPADPNPADNHAATELTRHSLLVYDAGFSAACQPDGITFAWRPAPVGDGVGFRLLGNSGQVEWEVPCRVDSNGRPTASDRYRADSPGTELAYSLYHHAPDFGWLLVAVVSVPNTPPRLLTSLQGAVPNPFNPQTAVSFTVDRPRPVRLTIHDLAGRQIAILADKIYQPGAHSITWRGKDATGREASSGIYFARMQSESFTAVRKLTLIR